MARALRRLGGGGLQRLGQSLEIRLAVDERVATLVGEHVLAERGVERGEPLVDLAEALLCGGVQAGAGPDEVRVLVPREALLLGIEARLLGSLVHRRQALEERLVLNDA